MTTGTYERLEEIAKSDRFIEFIQNTYYAAGLGKVTYTELAARILDHSQARFGLSGIATREGFVLWLSTSRAKQPPAITVSLDNGQLSSPSARLVQHRTPALIQLFEAGADDTDVAADCPIPQGRVEAQGRVLLV